MINKYALNILHNERCRSKYLRDRGYRRNPHPLFDYKIGDKGVYKHVTKCVECDPKNINFIQEIEKQVIIKTVVF